LFGGGLADRSLAQQRALNLANNLGKRWSVALAIALPSKDASLGKGKKSEKEQENEFLI
jgi:hypothetical protein